jgi:hypothetical protein
MECVGRKRNALILLKRILKKYPRNAWTGLIWLRRGRSDELNTVYMKLNVQIL